MGLKGYERLLMERTSLVQRFSERLHSIAEKYGERRLVCPDNTISFGITLDNLVRPRRDDENESDYLKDISKDVSTFGAMLFTRCVSGTRVIARGEEKEMGGIVFKGFGSSTDVYPHAYMTAACAIGLQSGELDEFFLRLEKALRQYKRKAN